MNILETLKKYPLEVQRDGLREAIRAEYLGSLYKLCKDLLGYRDMRWHTHGRMIEALEADTARKLIVMPRGTFKSSIGCVGYPIWTLMSYPNERILIDSEVYENSKNFLREIKGHLASDDFQAVFGDWRSNTWNESEMTVSTRTKILKEASITASGIGAGKTGQHYDLIIGDDYNSPKNSQTSEQRAKVIRHYQMSTALLDPGKRMAIIGTRYAVDDVIGHILDKEMAA